MTCVAHMTKRPRTDDAAEATAAAVAGAPGVPPARVTLRPIRGGDLQVLRAAAEKTSAAEESSAPPPSSPQPQEDEDGGRTALVRRPSREVIIGVEGPPSPGAPSSVKSVARAMLTADISPELSF